jgi:type VI secretion system protein ImpJ
LSIPRAGCDGFTRSAPRDPFQVACTATHFIYRASRECRSAMKLLSRVVWQEGMHLSQHHFQTQNRYFEDSMAFALGHLFYKPYGLAGISLDAEALPNGTVSLVHARGVMPDGLSFHMPEGDPLPEARDIRETFSPTHESHLLLLVVPAYRSDGANFDNHNRPAQPARYREEMRTIRDEMSGRDERPVGFGRKNFRLVLDVEPVSGEIALPIARVRRDGSGHFIYDPEYVPPCVQIGASERLMQMVLGMVEMLDAKSDAMSAARRAESRSLVEYASHDVANFWLLHTMHTTLAPMRQHLESRQSHPERLFVDLSRLAGALCTFALDAHPRALPLYDHDNLSESFAEVQRQIRARLDVIIPTNSVRVALQQTSPVLYSGAIVDKRCFGRARWLLAVRSSASDATIVSKVPQLVKICSSKFTMRLVQSARPGLGLEHVPVPPSAVSPRSDTHYFAMQRIGPCWDTLVQTSEIGVYVPDTFPDAELELAIVLES